MYKIYKNTIAISKKCAKELYEAQKDEEFWIDEDDVIDYHGRLNLTSDNIFETNCLDIFDINESLMVILRRHKVTGEINAGYITNDYEKDCYWGYIFDKGIVTKLDGELVFREEE